MTVTTLQDVAQCAYSLFPVERTNHSEQNPKLDIRSPKEVRNPKSEFLLAVCAGDLLCGAGVTLRNLGLRSEAHTDSVVSDFDLRSSDFLQATGSIENNGERQMLGHIIRKDGIVVMPVLLSALNFEL